MEVRVEDLEESVAAPESILREWKQQVVFVFATADEGTDM
jgi:hypothetical protein